MMDERGCASSPPGSNESNMIYDSQLPVFQRMTWSHASETHAENHDSIDDTDDESEAEWVGGIVKRDGVKCYYKCISKRNGSVKFEVGDNVLLLAPGKSVPYVAKIDELYEDSSADPCKMASVRWYYRESDCDSKVLSERNKKISAERNSNTGPASAQSVSEKGDAESAATAAKRRSGKEVFASDFVDANPVDTFLKVRCAPHADSRSAEFCLGGNSLRTQDSSRKECWRIRVRLG
jgi:hypothetical protein